MKRKKIGVKIKFEKDEIYCTASYNRTKTRFPLNFNEFTNFEKLSLKATNSIRLMADNYSLKSLKGTASILRYLIQPLYIKHEGLLGFSLGNKLTYNQMLEICFNNRLSPDDVLFVDRFIKLLELHSKGTYIVNRFKLFNLTKDTINNFPLDFKKNIALYYLLKEYEIKHFISYVDWELHFDELVDKLWVYKKEYFKFDDKYLKIGLLEYSKKSEMYTSLKKHIETFDPWVMEDPV